MVGLVQAFGFSLYRVRGSQRILLRGFVLNVPLRVPGSHHIFGHPDLAELVNLQNVGGKAKPYQIRQFLRLVERYDLKMEPQT